MKIEGKENFFNKYNKNIPINNNYSECNFDSLDKNQITKREKQINEQKNNNNNNQFLKYENYKFNKVNNLNIIEKDKIAEALNQNNGLILKGENEIKNENNEVNKLKIKANKSVILKKNFLNNGLYNINERNIYNKIIDKNEIVGELDQNIKNDEIIQNNIGKSINLFNNKIQNNGIIKININNIRGKYQYKRDLNKIKETENNSKLITQSLTGLVNLGETCYMNTGLQNIIHCRPFINQLFTILNEFKDIIEEKIITYSFINLCLSLIKNENYINRFNINSFDPSNFRINFCKCHKEYSNHEQHDSLEFLRVLLDDISKELNQTKIISKYKELVTEGKSKEEQNFEYNNFYLCRENSIIVKVFYSQIVNIFTCSCGDISFSFEKILDIPLLFPKDINNKEIYLNDLLHHYFNGEKIVWSLECKKCGQKNLERDKKIKLSILPEVIIFSLQRFNPITGIKINKIINFEEIIDLKPFCDYDLFNGEINTKYKLFGISNHSGTINFGHYYSYTKVDDIWYEFNDSFVKQINLNLMSRAAYFFFYEKIE